MSAVIQRKKVKALAQRIASREPSIYDQNYLQYVQHLRLFETFEKAFRAKVSKGDMRGLKEELDTFYQDLKRDEFLINDLCEPEEATGKDLTAVFLLRKAREIVKLLVDFLVNKKTFVFRNSIAFETSEILSPETKDAVNATVKILKLFVVINPDFAKILSKLPVFIRTLLRLTLENPKAYFELCLRILEGLITIDPHAITPELYPDISMVLSSLPRKYFARFSRIIALFALENADKTDFKELAIGFCPNKMIQIHSFLLSIPNFLETYISILHSIKEMIQSLVAVTPENIHKTITNLRQSKVIKNSGVSLTFLKSLFMQGASQDLITQFFSRDFIVKLIVKKSNITEILFILSNLLAGKRKVDIQDRLTQLNFFSRTLEPLFDILFDHQSLRFESSETLFDDDNESCASQLNTARIQLLRVIINFCDRDYSNFANKSLFISPQEKQLLHNQLIQPNSAYALSDCSVSLKKPPSKKDKTSPESIKNADSAFDQETLKRNFFESVPTKGLMNKIILLLNKTNADSNFHFWLASCVESFLRGFHSSHQVFVAHSGLLYHLLDQIVTNKITKPNHIQITYDLVGEIIKFNKHNMILFETMCKEFGWTQILIAQVEQNVVDSNVFLRSILLTVEKLDLIGHKEKETPHKNVMKPDEPFSFFRVLLSKRLDWLKSLVEAVDSSKVNQDNICCINTALIIAILADQRGKLSECLENLSKGSEATQRPPNQDILVNFSKVLDVWQNYYLSKTKDCFSLQYTTSIKFNYFQNIQREIKTYLEKAIETGPQGLKDLP